MTENEIGRIVVDCAVKLHIELGPGLLESVYEVLLAQSLSACGLNIERQVSMPLEWKDVSFEKAFIADLIVENKVIVELKSLDKLNRSHSKQLLTYLKMSDMRLGFLLNFGQARMKDGIVRVINGVLE